MREELRTLVKEQYGLDLNKAAENKYPGSIIYTFLEEKQIIFVRCGSRKARKTVLSETLWMDNLNLHTDAVCVPVPSADSHLTELLELDGVRYTISLFQGIFTPVQEGQQITAEQIQQLGVLLGKIHAASKLAGEEGFHYQRKKWCEILRWGKDFLIRQYGDAQWNKIEMIITEIEQYPETTDTFGLIHGDFHWQNFYQKDGTLGVFDFDSCQYSFYMHDIASVYRACQKQNWPDQTAFLTEFRKGYDTGMILSEEEWTKLEYFMELDACFELLTKATMQVMQKPGE